MKKVLTLLACIVMVNFYTLLPVFANESSTAKLKNPVQNSEKMILRKNNLNITMISPKEISKARKTRHAVKQMHIEKHVYKVEKGDTLWGISRQYGKQVTVEKLKDWNDLSSDLIQIDQKLVIYGKKIKTAPAKQHHTKTKKSIHKHPAKQTQQPSKQTNQPKQVKKTSKNTTKSAKPITKKAVSSKTVSTSKQTEHKSSKQENQKKHHGKTFTVEATAYTAQCAGCSGRTATGLNLRKHPNKKVIAVDPSVIPLGSKVYVEGYGTAIAADTGGAIKGNRIDVFIPSKKATIKWGRRHVKVTVLH